MHGWPVERAKRNSDGSGFGFGLGFLASLLLDVVEVVHDPTDKVVEGVTRRTDLDVRFEWGEPHDSLRLVRLAIPKELDYEALVQPPHPRGKFHDVKIGRLVDDEELWLILSNLGLDQGVVAEHEKPC